MFNKATLINPQRAISSIMIILVSSLLLISCGDSSSSNGVVAQQNTLDPDIDHDGDGWTISTGDCCEDSSCTSPEFVNPGAAEITGNGIDDDCDVATADDTASAACSLASKFSSVSGVDLAGAMELCQTVSAADPIESRKWGLISAELRNADGSVPSPADLAIIQDNQAAVLEDYGTGGIVPRAGGTMAGTSNGMMRDATDPGHVPPSNANGTGGTSFNRTGSGPASYLAIHNDAYPVRPTCPSPGNQANDSVNLRLEIRVPTNATGFLYDWRFFSADYPAWACTQFNDPHLALLTSAASGLPADKNISLDGSGYPVSVNSSDLMTHCAYCPNGITELAGTGMEPYGGTGWITTSAPVVPGETIVLELMVFDVVDNIVDTVNLYDNFRWTYAQ